MGTVVTIVIIIVVAAAVVALLARSSSGSAGAEAQPAAAPSTSDRVRPPLAEFHVKGDTALVSFAVPLPAGDPDEVIVDLLAREAVEVFREKKAHGLPLGDVTRIQVFGTANGREAQVTEIELSQPGEIPDVDTHDLIPHVAATGYDPLAAIDTEAAAQPGVAEKARTETLGPIGEDIRLSRQVEASLRAQGVDPQHMSAGDMALALLRLSGYQVAPGTRPNSHMATRAGERTYVEIVDHQPDDYPELEDRVVTSFMLRKAESRADRGLLITDKYSPYSIYEKERRDPSVRFLSRERLQSFVDGFTVS